MSERKILYYPTILVPTRWLKWTILYWDKVSSIVPKIWEDEMKEKPSFKNPQDEETYRVMRYLEDEGEYEPTIPSYVHLISEFKEIIRSPQFQSKIDRNWRKNKTIGRVHKDKVSYGVGDFLEDDDLMMKDEMDPNWFLMEENTSMLFMALLAKYLADVDSDYTTPSTDWKEYETLIYESSDKKNGFPSLNTKFLDVLPVPKDDVSIEDILRFKKKRNDELLYFREVIDGIQREISHAESENEINQLVVQYKEGIERKTSDLKKTMEDSNIKTKLATFKSLIDIKSPVLIEAIGFSLVSLSPAISIPVLSATAAVQVGYTWVDNKNRQMAKLRESPYSFLYYAKEERVIYGRNKALKKWWEFWR